MRMQSTILKILRNWTLPISILTGIASYFIYVNLHCLDGTHAFANKAIGIIQPTLVFCMLFVSFCKIKPRELKPQRWFVIPLFIQVAAFVLGGLLLTLFPDISLRFAVESFMICMICPTATAASVVTDKLHGNAGTVVNYTCLINLAASLIIPAIVPLIHTNGDQTFATSFSLIIAKVFPLLVLPLALSWIVRYQMRGLHKRILSVRDLAFYLWAVALALAIAITVKAIVHSDCSFAELSGIAVASLIACAIQFALGRCIGNRFGELVAGTQSLGQKNTVFAIWMGYTFMEPVTAMAGGFYSLWHNVVNSYQLYKIRKQKQGT